MNKGIIVAAIVAAIGITVINSVCVVTAFNKTYISRQSSAPGFNRLFLNAKEFCNYDVMCEARISSIAKRDAYFNVY